MCRDTIREQVQRLVVLVAAGEESLSTQPTQTKVVPFTAALMLIKAIIEPALAIYIAFSVWVL